MNSMKCYQDVQHQTTDQGGILVLLHDGIIREIKRAKKAIELGKPAASHLLKTQMGVVELDRTLNFKADPELAEALHQIYLHLLWNLSDVLESQSLETLEQSQSMIQELRDTWAQAAVASRQERRAG